MTVRALRDLNGSPIGQLEVAINKWLVAVTAGSIDRHSTFVAFVGRHVCLQ